MPDSATTSTSTSSSPAAGRIPVVLPAEDIEAASEERTHRMSTAVRMKQSTLTKKVGITDQGVHLNVLDPGQESTALHYHLQESEWFYILSGSGYLLYLDSSTSPIPNHPSDETTTAEYPASSDPERGTFNFLPSSTTSAAAAATGIDGNGSGTKGYDSQVRKHPVKAGDFIGFPGGIEAARWGHGFVAGDEGLRYLCGGSNVGCDVCVYPLAGRATASQGDQQLILARRD